MQAALCQLHSFTDIRKVKEKGIGFTLQHLYISRKIRPIHLFLVRRISLGMSNLLQRSVQFSHSVMSDSLQPHESQHARPPCPSPTPGVHPNSCPSSQWCHPAISSSVIPVSSCPQSLPASESFPVSQLFTWGGQSIGVLPKNTKDWSPLGWTGWISLQSFQRTPRIGLL